MSTPEEQRKCVEFSVKIAERRLQELDSKPTLTRTEQFERDMTVECIRRGKELLKKDNWK